MSAWPVVFALGALGAGFVLGQSSVTVRPGVAPLLRFVADQANDAPLTQDSVAGDPRELIPLTPGTGPQPGAAPPGPTPGQGECTVLMFRDGQFYRMQPGTPAPGGTPQGDSEVFPLQPQQTPAPVTPPFPAPDLRT